MSISNCIKGTNGRIQLLVAKLEASSRRGSPDLARLPAQLNISLSRFRHLFKKEMGMSPGRYVKLVRLQNFRKLLSDSNLRVKEAVAASGLSDFSHAVRDYKAIFGETPSQTACSAKTIRGAGKTCT